MTRFEAQITLCPPGSWGMPSSSTVSVFLLAKRIRVLRGSECAKALQARKRQIILYISIMASLIHVASKLYSHDLSNLSLHGRLSMPLIISFALPETFPMSAFRGREAGIGNIILSEGVSCRSVIPLQHLQYYALFLNTARHVIGFLDHQCISRFH